MSKYVAESINQSTDWRTFHLDLRPFCTQLIKTYVAEMSCNQLIDWLILLHIFAHQDWLASMQHRHFNLYWIPQSSLAPCRVGAGTWETQTCSSQLYNHWCSNLSVFLLCCMCYTACQVSSSCCSAWHIVELNICSFHYSKRSNQSQTPPLTLVNTWGNTLFDDFVSINASKPESHTWRSIDIFADNR